MTLMDFPGILRCGNPQKPSYELVYNPHVNSIYKNHETINVIMLLPRWLSDIVGFKKGAPLGPLAQRINAPRIYISWAMLISSELGETAAYGLCVLYILGSGLSKLRIGELGSLSGCFNAKNVTTVVSMVFRGNFLDIP